MAGECLELQGFFSVSNFVSLRALRVLCGYNCLVAAKGRAVSIGVNQWLVKNFGKKQRLPHL